MKVVRSEKGVYDTPQLTVHGDMTQITQTNEVCNLQDALGVPPPITGSEFAPPVCS